MKLDICKHCGEPEAFHHEFEPMTRPDGCTCDPRDWVDPANVPPICQTYVVRVTDDGTCATCEHHIECHTKGSHS